MADTVVNIMPPDWEHTYFLDYDGGVHPYTCRKGNTIYTAFPDDTSSSGDILRVYRSLDNGTTWENLYFDMGNSVDPELAIDDNDIFHLAYLNKDDYNIYYTNYTGSSWLTPENVTEIPDGWGEIPRLLTVGNKVYVFFVANVYEIINYRIRENGSWSDARVSPAELEWRDYTVAYDGFDTIYCVSHIESNIISPNYVGDVLIASLNVSTDTWSSFSLVVPQVAGVYDMSRVVSKGSMVSIVISQDIYNLENGNWVKKSNIFNNNAGGVVQYFFDSNNNCHVGSYSMGYYKDNIARYEVAMSSDNGATWTTTLIASWDFNLPVQSDGKVQTDRIEMCGYDEDTNSYSYIVWYYIEQDYLDWGMTWFGGVDFIRQNKTIPKINPMRNYELSNKTQFGFSKFFPSITNNQYDIQNIYALDNETFVGTAGYGYGVVFYKLDNITWEWQPMCNIYPYNEHPSGQWQYYDIGLINVVVNGSDMICAFEHRDSYNYGGVHYDISRLKVVTIDTSTITYRNVVDDAVIVDELPETDGNFSYVRFGKLVLDNSVLHLAWYISENINTGTYQYKTKYSSSSNFGQTWSTKEIVYAPSDANSGELNGFNVVGGYPMVIIGDYINQQSFVKKRVSGVWEDLIYATSPRAINPKFVVSSGVAHIIYETGDYINIYEVTSSDNGNTWSGASIIASAERGNTLFYDEVVVEKDNELHMIYPDRNYRGNLWTYKKFSNGNWEEPMKFSKSDYAFNIPLLYSIIYYGIWDVVVGSWVRSRKLKTYVGNIPEHLYNKCSLAVERLDANQPPNKTVMLYLENGLAKVSFNTDVTSINKDNWQHQYDLVSAKDIVVEYNCRWDEVGTNTFKPVTIGEPFYFLIDNSNRLVVYQGQGSEFLLAENVKKMDVVRGWDSNVTITDDQGLICAYIKDDNKIYYRNYTNQGNNTYVWENETLVSSLSGYDFDDVSVFRTNDYRIGFVVQEKATGNIYQMVSSRNWAGVAINNEYINANISDVIIDFLNVTFTDGYETNIIATGINDVVIDYLYGISPVPTSYINSNGTTIVFTFDHDIFNVLGQNLYFTVVDSENNSFVVTDTQYGVDNKTLVLTCDDFNNAHGDITVSYIGTLITGEAGQTLDAFSVTFTPVNLNPLPEIPPIPIEMYNIE